MLIDFPTPTNRTEVRLFSGLIQQFELFCPWLSKWLLPLRSLLSSNVVFVWEQPQEEAFKRIINELSSPRLLANFDGTSPLRLETYAAQSKGLAFALWQQQSGGVWRLLQCCSRRVTPTKGRYSAIEIELLAVVWAVKKARLFLACAEFE